MLNHWILPFWMLVSILGSAGVSLAQTPDAEYCVEPGMPILGYDHIEGVSTTPSYYFTFDVDEDFDFLDLQIEVVATHGDNSNDSASRGFVVWLTSPSETTVRYLHPVGGG